MLTWTEAKLDTDNKAWEAAKVEYFVLPGQPIPANLFSKIAMRAAQLSKELKEEL